jgi:hypothetical protein
VYVLGDQSLSRLSTIDGVEFVDIEQFRHDADVCSARDHYVHRSSNGKAFESFCFERVFILRRFLESRRLERAFHLDSDCVLLQPLSRFPLHEHRVWLVNNDHYHLHGFSPLPSASIHAALLDVSWCTKFEELYRQLFVQRARDLPAFVGELLDWADAHAGQPGGMCMTLGLERLPPRRLLQSATCLWLSHTPHPSSSPHCRQLRHDALLSTPGSSGPARAQTAS